MPRIHIVGASGSGATTLGQALAAHLDIAYVDSDDLLWLQTDPAYTQRRPAEERTALLRERLAIDRHWVFSGSALGWGSVIEHHYDRLVFLTLDPALRLARLRAREYQRYGARILPGGDMADGHAEFIDWAAQYDTGIPDGRSLVAHEAWLADHPAPKLRLDSAQPTQILLEATLAWLEATR
jgi:adenylate kinase family enzyme